MTKKMPEAPKPTPGDKKFGRSAVTNGKLVDGDMRSKQARRLRDLINDFTTELGGGDLSPSEVTLIRTAAMAAMRGEELQARMVAGEPVDDEDIVRVGNLSSRAVRDLHAMKAKRKDSAKPASMEQTIADEYGEEDHDAEIEEVDFIMPPEDEPHWRPVAESVQKPSAPETVAAAVADEPVIEAPKPQGPIVIQYDARPRRHRRPDPSSSRRRAPSAQHPLGTSDHAGRRPSANRGRGHDRRGRRRARRKVRMARQGDRAVIKPKRQLERVPSLPRPPRKAAGDPLAGLRRFLSRHVVHLIPKAGRP